MIRKFIIYFLYYVPIFKFIKVKAYTQDVINSLQLNQLAFTKYRYWIKDKMAPDTAVLSRPLQDFPENLILILSDTKQYRYVHSIRDVIIRSYNRGIFDIEKPNIENILIYEYLETHLFKI